MGETIKWLLAGQKLAKPPVGEDVVITGMSGCFPESNNIYEFRDNLANKVDMVTYDTRRWEATHPEIPKRAGKVWFAEKFDAGFFGVHGYQVDALDPLCRILIEKAYECVLDAGLNPNELKGSNTGVFVGACASESEKFWLYDNLKSQAYAITGCHRSMLSARISYWFGLNGPAFVMDTACSSSFYAFEHAYRAIREGKCERAIVAGTNLCLHPYVNLQFSRLGVLSMDGACKCFDEAANGYARSEAVCAILLQKSKEAKRVYAKVIHSKVNADGYKEQGITYPSGDTQMCLIREVYAETGINPTSISYMEAHGTGTKVGDPEELKAIEEIFVPGRRYPLLIGSVKSNIGHTEPTSGLCSVVKVVLSMEGGKILPNMNYKNPKKSCQSLVKGKLVVVTENTNWPDGNGLVGINSFGFGGANCHSILKWQEQSRNYTEWDGRERLVCVTGRTEEAVLNILDDITNRSLDVEFIRLLHDVYRYNIPGNNYRGFALFTQEKEITREIICKPFPNNSTILMFGNDINCNEDEFIYLEKFKQIFDSCKKVLKPEVVDLSANELRIISTQIAIGEVLKDIGLCPKYVDGYGYGVITAAYFDGVISLQEAMLIGLGLVRIEDDIALLRYMRTIIGTPRKSKGKLRLDRLLSAEYLNKLINANRISKEFNEENVISIDSSLPSDSLRNFFIGLGRLYNNGLEMDIHKMYQPIPWPVKRGTPMISPLIKWDHSKDYFVTKYRTQDIIKTGYRLIVVSLKDEFWKFLSGHVVDGRNLFPATGYLHLAWEVLSNITGKMTNNMEIIFEDVKFLRATTIPQENLNFLVMMQRGSGLFEIIEGGTTVVTGRIYEASSDFAELELPVRTEHLYLTQKDIYKELRLRGYNYKGLFKSIQSCNVSASSGFIEWNGNWITFLDNILQMQILQEDTRSLYVPTVIKRLSIAPKHHLKVAEVDKNIPVYAWKNASIIRSGGIEIRGLVATTIAKRKLPAAILETYSFIPNKTSLSLEESLRVNLQIILEISMIMRFKIVEIDNGGKILIQKLQKILGDQPCITGDFFLVTNLDLEMDGVNVERKTLKSYEDCDVVITKNFREMENNVDNFPSLKSGGFIISLETNNFNFKAHTCLTIHQIEDGYFYLLQKKQPISKYTTIEITKNLNFIPTLQKAIKSNEKIILYTKEETSGILGLVNCLRRERFGDDIRCFVLDQSSPIFDLSNPIYKKQFDKGFAINIYKNKSWGTFRHLEYFPLKKIECKFSYVNVVVRGDLSTLSWIEGAQKESVGSELELVEVHYGSVNFRDVMTASGRVAIDAVTRKRLEQECVQGFEFAGIDTRGRRVMGMLTSGALATHVEADKALLAEIPQHWSLEDAVTVPVVYCTALYAFFIRGKGLKKGQSILIHSGTGGVGQAAIQLGLHFGCTIFTTVGTTEKKDFLLKTFPKLNPKNISSSRNTNFEEMIKSRTKGRGVDYVLNSLSEDKLQASVKCLAPGGCFLEIGKFDLFSDNLLSMELDDKSFHGIMLDGIFTLGPDIKQYLMSLLMGVIRSGAVKPLIRTCFESDQLEAAFRFMATGKHIGKVVVKINDESQNKKILSIPRFYCPNESVCIIFGGLGGFGMELADWLIMRGCRKLILTSRNGIKTGYQAYRIKIWKTYGTMIKIITNNLITKMNCEEILRKAEQIGPVHAIFNLAVVLNDALIENQGEDSFKAVMSPKSEMTRFLDEATREICPNLNHFVVFSSVSCGRGNAGQTNYGMANSIMERICEKRKMEGYPALAIQWGAIGDVGLVAELQEDHSERAIGGTLQQRVSNCLEILDQFLRDDKVIVSSMVVAEKGRGVSTSDNMVDSVVNILGLRDLNTVSLYSTLAELGMDSMMAVEIKQTLEREYEVFLTPTDIRTLTFAKLQELSAGPEKNIENVKTAKTNVQYLLRFIDDEESSKIPIIFLPNSGKERSQKVLVLPGVEGFASIMSSLCKKIALKTICLQFTYENPGDTLQEMAEKLLPYALENLNGDYFNILAYSYGCTVAIELALLLEIKGISGRIILIDGAHEMMLRLTKQYNDLTSPATFETSLLCNIFSIYLPLDIVDTYKEDLLILQSYEERINFVQDHSPETKYSREYIGRVCTAFYKRVNAVVQYKPTKRKLKSQVTLLKPKICSVTDISEDYNLSTFTENSVNVKYYDDDHYSILESEKVARDINNILLKSTDTFTNVKEEGFKVENKPSNYIIEV